MLSRSSYIHLLVLPVILIIHPTHPQFSILVIQGCSLSSWILLLIPAEPRTSTRISTGVVQVYIRLLCSAETLVPAVSSYPSS